MTIILNSALWLAAEERERRIAEIEQALKRDPDRDYRRQLVREYLDLTEPNVECDL